jgi:hypothetical protein
MVTVNTNTTSKDGESRDRKKTRNIKQDYKIRGVPLTLPLFLGVLTQDTHGSLYLLNPPPLLAISQGLVQSVYLIHVLSAQGACPQL